MSSVEDYTEVVEKIFKDTWTTRDGQKVPESKDLGLGNDAVKWMEYADLDELDSYKPELRP